VNRRRPRNAGAFEFVDAFRRVVPIAPLIQTAVERTARINDAFRRALAPEQLIQTAVERMARIDDAFKSGGAYGVHR
jgi:hypothetical protein